MASLPSLEPFEARLAGLAAADRFTGSVAVTRGGAEVFAGAYGFAMASNYNFRMRPAEVLVENGAAKLVRRRENYEDLIRPEIV